jgi:glycosyltransferase involved in cell wall biosynthesis
VGWDRITMRHGTICFIVPRINRTGGYERQAITLAHALRAHGARLRVLTDSEPLASLEDCRVLPHRTMLGTYLAFRREFADARDKGPVVVHLHALYRFSAVGLRAAMRQQLPTLLKLPSSTDVRLLFRSPRLALRLFQPTLQRVDRFLCPSHFVAEELRPFLRRPEASVYLPNGVDTRRFCPSTAEEQRRQRDQLGIRFQHVMLHVGRHVPLKGGDVLIRAFAQTRGSLPADTGLVFLGDGEQAEAWKHLVDELGIGRAVLFAPTHAEPERYFQAADAFVLPSLQEGMPNALLEAMACGLPCVASDTGGIRDVLADSFPGQLVAPGDVDALAAALTKLFQPAMLVLGTQMREHVAAHFSIDIVSQRLTALYDELIRSNG